MGGVSVMLSLSLISFNQHNVVRVLPWCNMSVPNFFCQIVVHCMDVQHFIIHSSVDGHLGLSIWGLL